MALSYYNASEAPRDFRVSSTESDGHYKKCLLCYTVKMNFYCSDCIKTGSFTHTSMPYADRYSEKQAKLLRLKVNRKHVLDRCEKLLALKLKRDTLLTEAKQSRDRLDLLRLAIDQRRSNIEEKRRELMELRNHNNELSLKLPKYQKRVLSVGKLTQTHRMDLENKVSTYHEQAESLATLRRSRIRQLTKYIFPVYMSYDTSDSIEDMEFIGEDTEEEPPQRPQLHIVAPWINVDGDYSQICSWLRQNKEWSGTGGPGTAGAGGAAAVRAVAALALCSQLLALLAWALDQRLPHTISLNEYCNYRVSEGGVSWRARRLSACSAALCARAALPPPAAPRPPHALAALHALVLAASTDDPMLGSITVQRRAVRARRAAAARRAAPAARARRAARASARRQHGRPHAGQSGGVDERVLGGGAERVGRRHRGVRGPRHGRQRAARAPALARGRRDGGAVVHAARGRAGALARDVSGRVARLHVARVHQVTGKSPLATQIHAHTHTRI